MENKCDKCKALEYRVNQLSEILIEAMQSTGLMKGLNEGLKKRMELQKAFYLAPKSKGIQKFVKKARSKFGCDVNEVEGDHE